ncbi:MAG: stage IV sporulation protein A, partial [Oscillospiraceae bacterium]|nr:stage IV sporulation protein A [Oscillospiraceae bacterium]
MEDTRIYQDIARRTGGDIYIGVVGPVRTGKSTMIRRFMDALVIPNISGKYQAERALDELPQASAGRTIMTTEPKFIPEDGVEINVDDTATLRVRMIDCVGYIVPSSLGYIEDNAPRMVKTPWFDEEVPFNMAAEVGTRKVITDHSTIGLVVTTDGTISDIPREEYAEAEERVIGELKDIKKPFAVLLNCIDPTRAASRELAEELSRRHEIPVLAVNCEDITEEEIREVLAMVLYEFPVKKVSIDLPGWMSALGNSHWLKSDIFTSIKTSAERVAKIREVSDIAAGLRQSENIQYAEVSGIELGSGAVKINAVIKPDLFYKILGEQTGLEISGEADLLRSMMELSEIKRKYDRIKNALDEVEATGYGIVMPSLDELTLEEPEMMKQGGRYGVKLRASAPSIHMLKANITTEV